MTAPSAATGAPTLEGQLDRLAGSGPTAGDLEAARARVLDVVVAIRLGRDLPQWEEVRRALVRDAGGGADGRRSSRPTAAKSAGATAAALAACCRMSEVDDIELTTCTTPGSVVVPAALAARALGGAPPGGAGEDLFTAVAVGYEVVVEAAALLGGAFAPAAGVWPTRAVAALGAAATAARALALPWEAAQHAVALAAGAASSGTFPEPARSWSLGTAVAHGLAAALAAAEGLHGDTGLLARWPDGMYAAHLPESAARVAARLNEGPSAIQRSFRKPYAAARQVLAGSATLRALVESGDVDPRDVVRVVLTVPSPHAAMVDRPSPGVRLDTLASAQLQLATALEAPERLDDLDHPLPPPPAVAARMATVDVVGADVAGFPVRWGARLELTSRGGPAMCHVADRVPGEESFAWEDVEDKARRLAAANEVALDGSYGLHELFALVRRCDWTGLVETLSGSVLREGGA